MGTVRTEEKSLNITRLLVRKTNTRSFGKVTSRAITRKWLFYVGKYDVCCIRHLHPQWVLDMYSNTSLWPLMYSCLWLGHLMSRKESKGQLLLILVKWKRSWIQQYDTFCVTSSFCSMLPFYIKLKISVPQKALTKMWEQQRRVPWMETLKIRKHRK